MATLYLKAAGGNFNGANWSTTGAAGVDSVTPTAADNCIAELASGNLTINSGSVCRSFDTTSGTGSYGGTITHTAGVTWTIGDGTAGAGNVALKLNAGLTYTLGNAQTSAITFASTSTTQQTVTSAGKASGNWVFSGATGNWLLSDAKVGTTTSITHTAGTLDMTGLTMTLSNVASSNSNTRTLTITNASFTLSNTSAAWNCLTSTGLTLNASGSTITLTGAGATFQGGTQTYGNLVLTGSGTQIITGGTNTFNNFTRTGTAAKTDVLQLNITQIVTGTLTLTGNSITNRLAVVSNVLGTARAFTCTNAPSLTNVNFRDITAGGAAGTWTGTSLGDLQGNSNITFTTAAGTSNGGTGVNRYWVGNAGNWSDTTHWSTSDGGASGASVPLPQDDVYFTANSITSGSQTITVDMPHACRNITASGVLNTPTITQSAAPSYYGSFTWQANFSASVFVATFRGRGSHTITSAGFGFNSTTLSAPGGTYTLMDAFTCNVQTLTITDGTWDANDFNVTCNALSSSLATARTIYMGSGTWTLQGTGTIWTTRNAGSLLVFPETSTIAVTNTATTTRTIDSSTVPLNNITYTASTPATLALASAGSFTLGALTVGVGRTVQFEATRTYNIKSITAQGSNYGYNYFPAVAGNYASIPDSVPLSITGDIDLMAYIAPTDWTPSAHHYLVTKFISGTNQASYVLALATDGTLFGQVTPDGTLASLITISSTTATGFTDGTGHWVRWTIDVNNGAAQRVSKFYTSNDPSSTAVGSISWTQLGTTVTTAGATSIFDSTSPVEIASVQGGTAAAFLGKFYRAIIRNGYDGAGSVVLDADFATKPFGHNSVADTSGNTSYLTGTELVLPGLTGNGATVPDSSALDITDDLAISFDGKLSNWDTSAQVMFSKSNGASDRSYFIGTTTNALQFRISYDGAAVTNHNSTASTGFAAGAYGCVGVTRQRSSGDVKFWTAPTGTTTYPGGTGWSQLGTTVSGATTAIFSGTALGTVGGLNNGITSSLATGAAKRVQVWGSIDGTNQVLDMNFATATTYASFFRESSSNAAVVTILGPVSINGEMAKAGDGRVQITSATPGSAATLTGGVTDAAGNYFTIFGANSTFNNDNLQLPGLSGNFAQTNDRSTFALTDLDVRAKISLDDWTPSATNTIAGQFPAAPNRSWRIYVDTAGRLNLQHTSDGTNLTTKAGPILGITDGTTKWVRVTLDVNDGAGNNIASFYTSDDGNTWTLVGTDSDVGTTSLFDSNYPMEIGIRQGNTDFMAGKVYYPEVRDGINGTVVANPIFAKTIASHDYLVIQDSTATGMRYWYAGANSVNVSNNTGWIFTATPSPVSQLLTLGVG